jgi:two-component system response regulator AtoC
MHGIDIQILAVTPQNGILDNIRNVLDGSHLESVIDPEKARTRIAQSYFDILILDFNLLQVSTFAFLMEGKSRGAYSYSILIVEKDDLPQIEELVSNGLINQVIDKQAHPEHLKKVLDEAVLRCREKRAEEHKRREILAYLEVQNPPIIGIDTTLAHIFKNLDYISISDENILITGETGTGKEVLAREIRRRSRRRDGPFIKINCGAIPETLIESELFGFKKGSFSGAYRDKPGKIEHAHKGTLFLDEITELRTDLQTRLLQVIQEKQVERIGDSDPIDIDFRLIAATNRGIGELINEEVFRRDLYFRVSTLQIDLPPLRERREDIKNFVDFFLRGYTEEIGRKPVQLSYKALLLLERYQWPGNIRELENALKRAVIMLDPELSWITEDSFRFLEVDADPAREPAVSPDAYSGAVAFLSRELENRRIDLKTIERDIVKQVLKNCAFSVPDAVNRTGIQKDKLYKIVREHRIP